MELRIKCQLIHVSLSIAYLVLLISLGLSKLHKIDSHTSLIGTFQFE